MNSPCYDIETKTDCPDRKAGCAVECPKWAAYVEKRNADYEKRRAAAEARYALEDTMRRRNVRRFRNKTSDARRKRNYRK